MTILEIILIVLSLTLLGGNVALIGKLMSKSVPSMEQVMVKTKSGKRVRMYKVELGGKKYLFNFTQLRYAKNKYKKLLP